MLWRDLCNDNNTPSIIVRQNPPAMPTTPPLSQPFRICAIGSIPTMNAQIPRHRLSKPMRKQLSPHPSAPPASLGPHPFFRYIQTITLAIHRNIPYTTNTTS
eukprot:GFKZ01005053.1.p1 GENE.GFKZ01005053.1~~GFKZ01005053.1.p1  ORF type:complete len:102 (+),score=1.32 GFKZ01005053.1:404-709(+)